MLKQHARAVDLVTRLFDLVALTLALPVAHVLYATTRWGVHQTEIPTAYWAAPALVIVAWVAAAQGFRVYDTFRTLTLGVELGRIAKTTALVSLVSVGALFAGNQQAVSRLFVLIYFGVVLAIIASSRVTVRFLARTLRRRGYNVRRYAIVGGCGAAGVADDVARTFAEHPQWGYQLAGYVVLHEDDRAPEGAQVLGTVAELGRILEQQVLDEVVFAATRTELAGVDAAILTCEEQGVAVRLCLDAFRIGKAEMSLLELSGLPMLVYTRTSSSLWSLGLKRAFDVAVSAAALLLLAPILLATAVAIAFDSPGPIFFRQRRVGLNGREFFMWKFRSMYRDAEQRLDVLRAKNEMSGPVFKMTNDPRITRVGRFIRKTSIDELPQLWNVLRGEMSIVGPRPPIMSEVRQYKRWQRRRLSVRPGITCTWQVSGRNGIDFEQWMALDLEYIDHWSLWRDLQICARTIPAVLSARGAH